MTINNQLDFDVDKLNKTNSLHLEINTYLAHLHAIRSMPGLRRQGGQRKQWIDDLTEWSNNSIPDLVRKAQDRSAYQRFVYKVAHARNSGTAPRLIECTTSCQKH